MDTETKGVTLFELLGAFHFFTVLGLLLVVASAAVTAFVKRRKSGRTFLHPFVFLALSGIIFFWGQAASHWSRTSFALIQSLTGGTDYSDMSIEYARHSAIEAAYSSVASLVALVSVLFHLIRKPEPNQPAMDKPDPTSS